jgi:radical SAM protein with 4Fe4S-binding SPASM domain
MRGIFWELTARCNLRCRHCYLRDELTPTSVHPAHELNTQECLQVIDQFEEANVFHATVLGGEPFARPDILEILRYMGERKFWTRVDTNCTLINEDTARELADIGIKGMNVSLDGPLAGVNDAIRGRGSFEKAVQGINHLRRFGVPFYIGMTVNKINYTFVEKMAEFCFDMGAEHASFTLYIDFSSNRFSSLLRMGKEEIFATARTVQKIKGRFPKGFVSTDIHENLKFLSNESKDTATNHRFVRCGLGKSQLVILNNGDVIPCTYMRDICVGNVMKTHLQEIPDSAAFEEVKNLRKITIDDANEKCAACEWKYLCGGGCRGRAYLAHGDLLAPDPQRCLLARGDEYG